jgi:hypothetical protein
MIQTSVNFRRRVKTRNDTYRVMWANYTGAVSIVYGLWIVASLVVGILSFLASLTALANYGINYSNLYSAMVPLDLAAVVVAAVSVCFLIFFGYGCTRVGGNYGFPILTFAGLAWIASSIISVVEAVLALTEANMMLTSTAVALDFAVTVAVVGLVEIAVGLVASILIITASFQMQSKTGISAFVVAAALFIVGIFIGYVNIGSFIAFGVGLRTLASRSQGTARASQRPATEPVTAVPSSGVKLALFCPYCGARTAADDKFCRSCGSSLKQGS